MLLPFLLTLFEWYEFSVYNSIMPYIPSIIGSKSDVYLGATILACSYLARPIGSFFFSRYSSAPLSDSLKIMSISTLLIASLPTSFLPKSALILWIGVCKFAQGFAMGGSYGQNYIATYESSPNWVCYRVSIVQMGCFIGIILGEISTFLFKMAGGSIYGTVSPIFLTWGWRIPFLISSILGSTLLLYSDRFAIETTSEKLSISKIDLLRYFCIFLVIGIEMNVFYMWFVYSPLYREASSGTIFPALLSWLQKGLMVAFFPIMGFICDIVKSTSTILLIVCGLLIALSSFAPWSGYVMFITSSIIGATCYASLIPWCMSVLTPKERRSVVALLFSLAGSIFGGTLPLIASYTQNNFGMKYVGGIMLVYAVASAIGLIIISNISGKKTIDNSTDLK